jgi:hypothetical protein
MFDRVEAVRFDRPMLKGRTKPILINCERENGEEVEVVAKFSFGCDNSTDGLMREALAAMLAKDLGLPIPEPFLVSVTPEFIGSIQNHDVVQLLQKSDQFGFGSRKLPDGFGVWTAASGPLSRKLEQVALEIMAFDAWVTNGDRRVANPNLLTDSNSFAIFDHELTLMTTLNIGWQAPWVVGSFSGHNNLTKHIFYQSFVGKSGLDLSRICNVFSNISDDRINSYAQGMPPSWCTNNKALSQGVDFILELRKNIKLSAVEFLRALK